ncbi:MAG: acyl-CoA dehydrogenase family protein [Solirubrobacteraceae bacterium]
MSALLSDEQREIRDLARRFAAEEIAPRAGEWDRERHFPRRLFPALGELGLMGVCVPVEHGGAGADFLSYALVLEELSRADAGVGVTVAVHTSVGTLPLLAHGSAEQVGRLVPPLAQGHGLGAIALTEPGAGSDLRAIRTAWRDGGLHGAKQWITNGAHADLILVLAREADGHSAFLVRGGAPGLAVTGEAEKLGLHSSNTADLSFDATPAERLGPAGGGLRIALGAMDGGRIGIAAQAVGIAQAALDCAVAHARERRAFGEPIGARGQIQRKLADMQTEVEAARAMTHRAARLKDAGRPHSVEGAQAKLFASGVARRQTGEAIQVLGGYGYMTDFPAERYYRDAKVTEIYEGTSEIQRLVIARALLGEAGRRPRAPAARRPNDRRRRRGPGRGAPRDRRGCAWHRSSRSSERGCAARDRARLSRRPCAETRRGPIPPRARSARRSRPIGRPGAP